MNEQINQLIKIIVTSSPSEIKAAQKEIEKMFNNRRSSDKELKETTFKPFVEAIRNFDKIEDVDHQYYFVNTLKYPFFVLGDYHFEEWSELILKLIQNPSGKIRQAAISATDWLVLMKLWIDEDKYFLKKPTKSDYERIERDRARFCTFVRKVEILLDKYYEQKYRRYKYVSSLPPSVYKSLEKLMTECLLPTEYQKKIYDDYYAQIEVNDADDFEQELKASFSEFNQIMDNYDEAGAKSIAKYFDYHKYLPDNVRNLTQNDIADFFDVLSLETTSTEKKKKIIITLAHVGNECALKMLRWYYGKVTGELKLWTEIAIGECSMFIDSAGRE